MLPSVLMRNSRRLPWELTGTLREEFDFIKYQKLSDWTLVEQFSNKECDFNFCCLGFFSPPNCVLLQLKIN